MADKAIAVTNINAGSVIFEPGDEVKGVSNDALDQLVEVGAVKIEKAKAAPKPQPAAKKVTKKGS